MNKEELLAKITKLKALAERGVGGEKETAQAMLDRLMQENDISEADISQDVVKDHEFYYEKNMPFTTRLLSQIAYSVFGDIDDDKGVYNYVHKSKGRACVRCTDLEFLEVVAKYEFYVYHLAADLKILYNAFVSRNHLYPPKELTKPSTNCHNMTEDERKAAFLAMSLDKHEFFKQIEEKNNG